MPKRYDNNCILAFGDTHAPYTHKDALEFLRQVRDYYKPDRVIHLGDILDVYSVTSFPKDPDHPDSWSQEIKKARVWLKELYELFPEVEVMESNHDDRAYKKSRLSGIPREYLVPFSTIIGAPNGWTWHESLNLTVDSTRDKILFRHTMTGGSLVAARDLARTVVLGHAHSKFGATAFSPRKGKIHWGVDAGCLISDKGSPYKYNKGDRSRPIQGCVIINEGLPMPILL